LNANLISVGFAFFSFGRAFFLQIRVAVQGVFCPEKKYFHRGLVFAFRRVYIANSTQLKNKRGK
jgi:hypothetical protein